MHDEQESVVMRSPHTLSISSRVVRSMLRLLAFESERTSAFLVVTTYGEESGMQTAGSMTFLAVPDRVKG